jgi:hypothetical protein
MPHVSETPAGNAPMRFYGATRSERGKAGNDDAFACLGDRAMLLDGAGNAQGVAEHCEAPAGKIRRGIRPVLSMLYPCCIHVLSTSLIQAFLLCQMDIARRNPRKPSINSCSVSAISSPHFHKPVARLVFDCNRITLRSFSLGASRASRFPWGDYRRRGTRERFLCDSEWLRPMCQT